MKRFYTQFILVIFVLSSVACVSSKMMKRGSKMEAAGMYEDAAEYYYQAVVAKKTNIEALIGMKRTGQRVLEKKLSEFNKAYNLGNNQEAVYNYQEAVSYLNKVKQIGVELNFAQHYHDYYDEVKDIYLNDKYVEGSRFLETDNFEDAQKLFAEITKLQPNYKDAKQKLDIATYEPLYREALEKSDNKLYRSAYYVCERIINGYGNYKDVYDLKAECLKKASLNLAIVPIENKSSTTSINSSLEALIFKSIQDKNNPFIKIVEVKSNLADIKLYTVVSSFNYNKGTLNEETKTGYQKKQVKVKDEEGNTKTVTEYDKVRYKEFSMSRSVRISYTYKLVNVKTGEILTTNTQSFAAEDDINYAEYSGDKKNLVPGNWESLTRKSSKDVIRDNTRDRNALQSLLSARKVIKDFNVLRDEILNNSAERIAIDVNNYNPES